MESVNSTLKKIQGNKPGFIFASPVFMTSELCRGEENRKGIQNNYKRNFLFQKFIIPLILICAFYKAEANPAATLNGTVQFATGGIWSGGAGTYAPGNNFLNTNYSPGAGELAAGFVKLYLTTTGVAGICPNKKDSTIIHNPAYDNTSTRASVPGALFCVANQALILNVIASDGQTEVRVSFNGDEGLDGKLKIYNASKELVNQFEIKLKNSPDYFSILLNEFASGEYTVELTTSIGAHTGSFIIK